MVSFFHLEIRKSSSEGEYQNDGYIMDDIPTEQKRTTRPVALADFPEHFQKMKADTDYLFSEEYEVRNRF